jgi:hypothetical protein
LGPEVAEVVPVGVILAVTELWIPTPDQALSWSEAVWKVEPFSGSVEVSLPPLLPLRDDLLVSAAAVVEVELLWVKA